MKNLKVIKPDGTVKYKILNERDRRRDYSKSGSAWKKGPNGVALFAFDKGNRILFQVMNYEIAGGKAQMTKSVFYVLRYKNGKYNIYLLAYNKGKSSLHCVNPYFKVFVSEKIQKKIHNVRINRLLRSFCKRHSISVKFKNDQPYNKTIQQIIYPNLGININSTIDEAKIRYYIRNYEDWLPRCAKYYTGHKTKAVVKSIASHIDKSKSLEIFNWFINFDKKIKDQNYIVDIIKSLTIGRCIKSPQTKRILSILDDKHIIRLIRNKDIGFLTQSYYFSDISNYVDNNGITPSGLDINRIRWSSAKELHDLLVVDDRIWRRKNGSANFEIPIPEKLEKLHNFEIDNWSFKVGSSKNELEEWGDILNHCIGSYATQAKNEACSLIGIFYDNKLKYTIELRDKRIAQFTGKNNSRPEDNESNFVKSILQDKLPSSVLKRETVDLGI